MAVKTQFQGVVSAVVTPLSDRGFPHLDNLQVLIRTLKEEGIDGVLLLGTTGEGPSLSLQEREDVIEAGVEASDGMYVMAGTGFASLRDTVDASQKAFELGVDAVVVVPPYYYKNVPIQGLVLFFKTVLEDGVPDGKSMFLYDIPQVTKVPIPLELIDSLIEHAPEKLRGVKDSTGDLDHGREIIEKFPELNIFVGTDKLLLDGLKAGAAGCITAGSNLLAPLAVNVVQAYSEDGDAEVLQAKLTAARNVLETHPPFPPTLKSLLALRFGSSGWAVRYPLVPIREDQRDELISELKKLRIDTELEWLNALSFS